MEPRFGHDFSRVQVHTDRKAAESARAVNALAYTMGRGVTQDAGSRDASLPGGVASPPGSAPTPPTPPLQTRRACVSSEQIPDNHNGITSLQGNVYDCFELNVDWNNTGPGCDCRCGEYRQFVKGYIKVNGRKQAKPLWGVATLEENVYHEDGDGTSRYGHRSDPETSIDRFINPDRARGCSYRGRDMPGLAASPGTHLDMALTFKGQTYDVCQNTFGQKLHEWKVEFNGFVP
jgi:hypothetical protein